MTTTTSLTVQTVLSAVVNDVESGRIIIDVVELFNWLVSMIFNMAALSLCIIQENASVHLFEIHKDILC